MKTIRNLIAGLVLLSIACAALAQAVVNGQVPSVIPPGIYTASEVDGPTLTNITWTGADITFCVTNFASGTYTPHVQGVDTSGFYYDILVGAAISGNTVSSGACTYVLHVGSGNQAIPNVSSSQRLPLKWRVIMVGASTPSMTVVANANMGL